MIRCHRVTYLILNPPTQGWNYRLVIDNNRWRYFLLFFYRISVVSAFLILNIDLFLTFYYLFAGRDEGQMGILAQIF